MVATLVLSATLLATVGQQVRPSPIAPATSAQIQQAQRHYQNGWASLRSEAWDESAREFSTAIDLNPRFTLAYYGLGRAHMGGKRYVEAIRALEHCRDLYQQAGGQKFSSQMEANRARDDQQLELQEAIRITSQGPQSTRSQDMVRQFQNQLRTNREYSERGQNISIEASVPAFVSLSLGSAFFRAERSADAEREFKAAIAADSKLGEAYNNLAVVYLLSGRTSDAETAVKSAEKAGYRVAPTLKDEIKKRKGD